MKEGRNIALRASLRSDLGLDTPNDRPWKYLGVFVDTGSAVQFTVFPPPTLAPTCVIKTIQCQRVCIEVPAIRSDGPAQQEEALRLHRPVFGNGDDLLGDGRREHPMIFNLLRRSKYRSALRRRHNRLATADAVRAEEARIEWHRQRRIAKIAESKRRWADYVEHGGVDRLLLAWEADYPSTAKQLAIFTERLKYERQTHPD